MGFNAIADVLDVLVWDVQAMSPLLQSNLAVAVRVASGGVIMTFRETVLREGCKGGGVTSSHMKTTV